MTESKESPPPNAIAPVPTTIVYPQTPSSGSVIPAELLDVMRANPTEAMVLLKDIVAKEYELRGKELDLRQASKRAEMERQTRSDQATKNNLRMVILAISLAFFSSLGYGVVVKDSSLADKVFTGAMGLLGGSGGVMLLAKKTEEKEKS